MSREADVDGIKATGFCREHNLVECFTCDDSGMVADETGDGLIPCPRKCTICWYGETPKTKTAGCPCCEADHHGGHTDEEGRPQ
jgi:hypothetical protein